jgi:nitroimidazol reductase NimA-like FMN-containing flavoprotein (pyridoxamine 5'-phosphate oxidase superfamily)
MTKKERESFLAGVHVAVVAIPEPDRGPLTVPVWYWYEPGGPVWFETQPDSRKGRLLHVGKRISLCAQDETPPYAYVSVEGPIIEIAHDDRELHELPMAIRFLGEQAGREYIADLPPTEWKRYVLQPQRWLSQDGSGNADEDSAPG